MGRISITPVVTSGAAASLDSEPVSLDDLPPQEALETLEKIYHSAPRDPHAVLMLAEGYLRHGRPCQAYAQFDLFLKRFPQHPSADSVREECLELNATFGPQWSSFGFPERDATMLCALSERVYFALQQGDARTAIQAGEQFLARWRDYPAVWNNLGMAQILAGQFEAGIKTLREAIARFSQNDFGRGALVVALACLNELDQAREIADTFVHSESLSIMAVSKQIEALVFVGHHEAAYALAQPRLENLGDDAAPGYTLLAHIAAVAALGIGREGEAKRLWRLALRQCPEYQIAWENLNDLASSRENREGPFLLEIRNLIPEMEWKVAVRAAERGSAEDDSDLLFLTEAVMLQIPHFASLLPAIFAYGDLVSRNLAISYATYRDTPECRAALATLAESQRGSFRLRHKVAQWLAKRGWYSSNQVRLWRVDRWLEFSVEKQPVDCRQDAEVESVLRPTDRQATAFGGLFSQVANLLGLGSGG